MERSAHVLERDTEISAIAEALARARSGAGEVLLVRGPAGIGKTALLAAAARRAAARDAPVLRAVGSELERDYAFGLVHQLVTGPLQAAGPQRRERLLSGAAATARHVLPGEGPAPLPALDQSYAVLHGLYWLLANLVADRATLVVVDDAHWADRPSKRFLEFLARRIEDLPVVLLIGSRPQEEDGTELDLPATRMLLDPAPLSPRAVANVLAPDGAVAPAVATAARGLTGGNPFLVTELRGWLRREGLTASPEALARLRETGDAAVGEVVRRRLRLDGDALALAEAVAILGDGVRTADAAALAGLPLDVAAQTADALAAAGILTTLPLAFVHPLVRAAVRDAIPAAHRAGLHRAAAAQLAEAAAPVAAIAAQLQLAEPAGDPWVVAQLRAAAAQVGSAGAPDTAAVLLRRALAEPPPPEDRLAIALELGIVEARSGDRAALDRLAEVAERGEPAWLRVAGAVARARLLVFLGQLDAAVATLEPLAATLDDEDRDLALVVEAELVDAAWTTTSWSRRAAALDRFSGIAREDDVLWPILPVSRAFDLAMAGARAEDVEALAVPALAGGRLLRAVTADAPILYLGINTLGLVERTDLSLPLIDAALAEARGRGSLFAVGYLLAYRSVVELRFGSVAAAVAESTAALSIIVERGFDVGRALVTAAAVDALLEAGDLAGAIAALPNAPDPGAADDNPFAPLLHAAHARIALAQGRAPAAVAAARRAHGLMLARGWQTPSLVQQRALAVRAHLAAGEEEPARELAEEDLHIARTIGRPRATAIALRHLAAVPGTPRAALLDEALATLPAGAPARVERGRVLLELGRDRLAREDRAGARSHLAAALDEAAAAQAGALEAQARTALKQAGGRPRRPRSTGPGALTGSERRVADLAATGATNREIAAALFVSTKTVETHLSGVFRKLEISSRHEIEAARADPEPAP